MLVDYLRKLLDISVEIDNLELVLYRFIEQCPNELVRKYSNRYFAGLSGKRSLTENGEVILESGDRDFLENVPLIYNWRNN